MLLLDAARAREDALRMREEGDVRRSGLPPNKGRFTRRLTASPIARASSGVGVQWNVLAI